MFESSIKFLVKLSEWLKGRDLNPRLAVTVSLIHRRVNNFSILAA